MIGFGSVWIFSHILIHTINPPLDIDTGPFTESELVTARRQTKEGKASGEDGISAEVMKRVDLDDVTLNDLQ